MSAGSTDVMLPDDVAFDEPVVFFVFGLRGNFGTVLNADASSTLTRASFLALLA